VPARSHPSGSPWPPAIEGAYLALDAKDFSAADAALASARKNGAEAARVSEAVFDLGDARFTAGDEAGALPLFEAASQGEHGRSADALYKLGFVRLSRGELEAAQTALSSLLERHPESELAAEARFLLGECAYRAGDMQAAAQRLHEVLASARGELRAKSLFRSGMALARLERWSESEAALSELASSFPDFPNLAEGELWRGRALAAQKKNRAARAAFEHRDGLGELAAAARIGLGQLLEAEGRNDDALSEYLKVALLYAHEESVSEALYRAGGVLEELKQPEQAVARYRELCAEHASSPFAVSARERLHALEGR
jgi:TolA-binding protein